MKCKNHSRLLLACVCFFFVAADDPGKTRWTFEQETVGKTPKGFIEQVGTWKVVESQANRSLAQLAKNSDETFNVVLIEGIDAKDVDLSVKIRPIDGDLDRGGGLVWRAKDANNYYVARYNPLEDNFRVYKVEKGVRTLFQNAEIKPVKGWSTIRVTMSGDHIKCWLDGKPLLDVHDSTFAEAGQVGLWSKADARTEFDELTHLTSTHE